jgi:hypothetical protein
VEDDDGNSVAAPKPSKNAFGEPVRPLSGPEAVARAQELISQPKPAQPKSEANGSTEYVVKFGKFKGRSLSQIATPELLEYCDYLTNSAREKGEAVSKNALDLINAVTKYMDGSSEAQPKPVSQPDLENIPF